MVGRNLGFGSQVYLSTGYDEIIAGTATRLPFVMEYSLTGITREPVDCTPLSSTGFRDYLMAQPDAGEVPLVLGFSTTDAWAVDRILDNYLTPTASQDNQCAFLAMPLPGLTYSGNNPPANAVSARIRITKVGLRIERDGLCLQEITGKLTWSRNQLMGFFNPGEVPITLPSS